MALVGGLLAQPAPVVADLPAWGGSPPRSRVDSDLPNVLILMADDQTGSTWSRDLMPTVFSRLVDEGVQFTHAYVNSSLCCPSRSQILTGLYGSHTGVDQNTVKLSRPTIVQALHAIGYRTSLTGKYLNSMPCDTRPEFDQFVCYQAGWGHLYVNPTLEINGALQTVDGYTTDILAQYTSDFIRSTPADQPFFAMYTPISPHLPATDPRCRDNPVQPYRPPSFDEDTLSDGKPVYMQRGPLTPAEVAEADQDHERMTQAVECLDPAIGTILDSLGSREDDTIVFYLSDNGFLYGEHRFLGKEVPYQEAVNVPLVVRYPALVSESQPFVSDALVENIDLVPTIADIAGIPWQADGQSLVPLLTKQSTSIRDSLLIESCEGASYPCTKALPQEEGNIYVPSFFGVVTSQYSYFEYQTGEKELYDLSDDPYQLDNHDGDPQYAQEEAGLAAQLDALEAAPPVDTTIVSGPQGPIRPGTVTFVYFTQSRFATYQCKVDGIPGQGHWHRCGKQQTTFSVSNDDTYTFQVRAKDEHGNVDDTPASRTFRVDTTGPVITFDKKPSNPSNQKTAQFTFHADEALSSVTCQLDALPPVDCSSRTFTANSLSDGAHTLSVVASDLLGNQSTTSYSWTVDTLAPTVTITGGPASMVNTPSATFTFISDDPNATFRCAVNHGAAESCVSGQTYTGISDGQHEFDVFATDLAGNTGPAATWRWTVDTTAPIAAVTGGPADPTNRTDATLAFGSNDPNATLSCSLDGATPGTCTSPVTYSNLAEGAHSFVVTATDQAGNTSAPATWTWTVDVTAPTTTIDSGPDNPTNETTATFTFHADEFGVSFRCVLDLGLPAPCDSGLTYTGLAPGFHQFAVLAIDLAGNQGLPTAWQWTITGFSTPHRRL